MHSKQQLSRWVCLAAVLLVAGCDYLRHWEIQREYTRLQEVDPSQKNLKHLLHRPNFAIVGRVADPEGRYTGGVKPGTGTVAVAAFSSRFRNNELVDVMHDVGLDRHFGLNLPAGEFELCVLMDQDGDGSYGHAEVIGRLSLSLPAAAGPGKVASGVLIDVGAAQTADWSFELPAENSGELAESLFFPHGTIRTLEDPIFGDEMVTLGLYDPATFFGRAPTLFYALEEDLAFKIPVIFVHGAAGSAREFSSLVEQLDRRRFKPWFFHYPSGADLEQLGELFYDIYLSGDAVAPSPFVPTVIIAHSMGGLVVREALRRLDGRASEPWHVEFVSLATPFGGHPSARGVRDSSVLILPSWRDLDPDGRFLSELYREPLPATVRHHLIHAYGNESMVKFGENSDGVVPLSSQLHPVAQSQSSRQLGLASTHAGVLHDAAGLAAVREILQAVETRIPDEHMVTLLAGGVEVADVSAYTPEGRFVLRHYGKFLESLASGEIEPSTMAQRELRSELRGEKPATSVAGRAWRAFLLRHPK